MPKPIYIICSRSGSEDKITGLVSHYHVIETISLKKVSLEQPEAPFQFRVTSVWMREETDDPDQLYDFMFCLKRSDENTDSEVSSGSFVFSHQLRRTIVDITINGFGGAVVLEIRFKLRPEGGESWMTQSYPIILQITDS